MTRLVVGLAAAMATVCAMAGPARVAQAGEIHALVNDPANHPVEDAVVVAVPEGQTAAAPVRAGREAVDQVDKEFVPYVKPIVVGSQVNFPNKDNIRHHVYSFSPAKTFELPLYAGTPATPVVFDRKGVVTIGCNIHDWMIAHIYVTETPYFGKTGTDGKVRLENLPPGRYVVRVWHPRLQGTEESTSRTITVERSGAVDATWQLALKQELRPRRSPVPGQHRYR